MAGAPGLPSRVLMTADAVGGVWDYALELAQGLSRRAVVVDLAVMGPPPGAAQRAAAAAVPWLRLHEAPYRLEWMPDCDEDVARAQDWLLDLERRLEPDIVHVNGYVHAAAPFAAPTVAVAHSCVLSWWRAVHGADAPAEWSAYARRVRRGLDAADLIVAPTYAMLDALEACHGPTPRARVVPNGRNPAAFKPGDKEPMILSVGRLWDEAKNVAALAAAAEKVDWPVVVAGDWRRPEGGGDPPAHVTCVGRLPPPTLAAFYARAGIYCLPARYEPFGLSALEAALSGCALVLGDIPSLRELWSGAALFAPPDDPDALAVALNRLARSPDERAVLVAAGRRRAMRYGSDRMADAYLRAYAGLLKSHVRTDTPFRR